MLAPDRRRLLLQQVRGDGSARVDDLAMVLGVSSATVRRDLDQLADDGLLSRARGGAYIPQAADQFPPRIVESHVGHPETQATQRIAAHAADRIVDGMTIMILAGSTTGAIVPHLARRSVTVVTNGLHIAYGLAAHPHLDVVMLGGVLHREQMTFLGPMTAQSMGNLHVDIMFAGAYGVDPRVGVTGRKVTQAGDHHVMLRHTESLCVLAEGAKFGRQGPTLFARVNQVDAFLTDSSAPEAVVDELRGLGAHVALC